MGCYLVSEDGQLYEVLERRTGKTVEEARVIDAVVSVAEQDTGCGAWVPVEELVALKMAKAPPVEVRVPSFSR